MATCLRFLTNVELLELDFKCGRHKEQPEVVLPFDLPIFSELKNVTITFCMFSCFQMVTWNLTSSSNLKKLTIRQQERCDIYREDPACSYELTNPSSMIAVSPCKNLEIVEVKYWRYNQMVRRLVDTLMDGTKEFKILKIHLSKYERSR